MSTASKTLAKSLHTVTALVAVARLALRVQVAGYKPEDAVQLALGALGYEGAADPYGLAARATAILKAELEREA